MHVNCPIYDIRTYNVIPKVFFTFILSGFFCVSFHNFSVSVSFILSFNFSSRESLLYLECNIDTHPPGKIKVHVLLRFSGVQFADKHRITRSTKCLR